MKICVLNIVTTKYSSNVLFILQNPEQIMGASLIEYKCELACFCLQVAWRRAIKEVKAVQDTITSLDTHVKFLKGYSDTNPEFDNL
jgi:hypothetical protein